MATMVIQDPELGKVLVQLVLEQAGWKPEERTRKRWEDKLPLGCGVYSQLHSRGLFRYIHVVYRPSEGDIPHSHFLLMTGVATYSSRGTLQVLYPIVRISMSVAWEEAAIVDDTRAIWKLLQFTPAVLDDLSKKSPPIAVFVAQLKRTLVTIGHQY